ncbi:MAG: PrkA family serine protein kinase [Candidatus Levybacteria bacterium]|nr:PrkA family serine protein kinase [Candidatus Levybacteria bacterium]
MTNILEDHLKSFSESQVSDMSLLDFLDLCKTDRMAYATASERMINAIGEPIKVDTSTDPRLARIFLNRTILQYPAFKDFYGMEDTIERIVGYYKHAAQGLEEKKQILYLLGPVGGGKSSIAERLKELIEYNPIYVISYNDSKNGLEYSPVFESPLALFSHSRYYEKMSREYGIDKRYLSLIQSPWLIKRLKQASGDLSKFRVVKMLPSKLEQIAVCKTEPGDENNQDISTLVGKTDIRSLEKFSQNDTDAYAYSGALCRSNQGLMEFVEMFKAPIKVLHPLLTATQENNYMGTENISAIPFNGMVLAHSNMAEWLTFKNNKNNEAFIDRVCIIKVPYCLRVTDEHKIYGKMISSSELSSSPCAPGTFEMMAQWSVLTRLKDHENSIFWSKMKVYDGENIKETDLQAKSIQEYRDTAGIDEGMEGSSTRFAFKVLSSTYNHDPNEIAADPVHLMYNLENAIRREQLPKEEEEKRIAFIKTDLSPRYSEFVGNEIQTAYLEAYSEFGQTLFDRYINYADHWMQDVDYKDPDTGSMFNREYLNSELEKIEKVAGIANPKDFRHECVNFVLRQRASGNFVKWNSYEKLKKVIERKMFTNVEELLPVISFGVKSTTEDSKKHDDFVKRMMDRGYTEKQVRRAVEWFMRVRKA